MQAPEAILKPPQAGTPRPRSSEGGSDLSARGEPFLWGFGGALSVGILMVFGFLLLVFWNGIATFYPKPVEVVTLRDGTVLAGEPIRNEVYRPGKEVLSSLDEGTNKAVLAKGALVGRTLYHTGNFDLYNEDYRWIPEFQVQAVSRPKDMFFIERVEWGPFIGRIHQVTFNKETLEGSALPVERLYDEQEKAAERRRRIRAIERGDIGEVNHYLEKERLALRSIAMMDGEASTAYQEAKGRYDARMAQLNRTYQRLAGEAETLKHEDELYNVVLKDVTGREKTLRLSEIVRLYPANDLSLLQELGVYVSRWSEFLTEEPREANTEGGVMPAIFGTFAMTILLAVAVAPFGVIAALYLREYAKQGTLVSIVRISVNNLAGVPSIVYGVFGLGFFAYILGGSIDRLFFAERLPNPTFGTGGLLWSSLTLALLTVPVVIVATEEALAAVPQSMREGSLACGASKWQTIKNIVLPRATPGIMTGLILAMARGAGEVAPLMLVGVVKLAPELPIDHFFPFVHLERSFMHLGFHIYDVGFQSRNSEAGKPMVFVTTLLLIALVGLMNATAIYLRNRLRRKYHVGHF